MNSNEARLTYNLLITSPDNTISWPIRTGEYEVANSYEFIQIGQLVKYVQFSTN